jgi:hypothetical protein
MPGDVSRDSKGPGALSPYVPSWCYPAGPRTCPCGHHEGYHNDAGACLLAQRCHCPGIPVECVTPMEEM